MYEEHKLTPILVAKLPSNGFPGVPTRNSHGLSELCESEGRPTAVSGEIGPIVFACDNAFTMPLATAIRSLAEATSINHRPLHVYILSYGVREGERKKVIESVPPGSVRVCWVEIDVTPFAGFSTMQHISRMTYARFLIPSIVPQNVSKVLYLDSDVLVLDDLEPLWKTDLGGLAVAAALDVAIDTMLKRNHPSVEEVPRVKDYFNAGVLLIDLDRWRSERISEKAVKYLESFPQSPFSDQDALNVVCDGSWKRLDGRWNWQEHISTSIARFHPADQPGIVHFVTTFKPWKALSLSLHAEFYDSFRSRTRFARTNREKLSNLVEKEWSRLKRRLRKYSILRRTWNYAMHPCGSKESVDKFAN
jgi:lipopolysaccharide biosynthesis glycosyltransferase